MSEIYPETPVSSPAGSVVRVISATVAPELAAAMAETRTVREALARLCEAFGPFGQAGHVARLSLTVLNRHRAAAMLPELTPREAQGKPSPWDLQQAEIEQLRDQLDRLEADLARERDEARDVIAALSAELEAERATGRQLAARRDQYHRQRDEARQQLARAQHDLEASKRHHDEDITAWQRDHHRIEAVARRAEDDRDRLVRALRMIWNRIEESDEAISPAWLRRIIVEGGAWKGVPDDHPTGCKCAVCY